MTNRPPEKVPRRQFMWWCLTGGVATVAGGALCWWHAVGRRRPAGGTRDGAARAGLASTPAAQPGTALQDASPVIKNPAFIKHAGRKGAVLATRRPDGSAIAYRLDSQAEFLWDEVATVRQYHGGRRSTAGELVERCVRKFAELPADTVRREARAFLEGARRASLVMTPASYVVAKFQAKG